jgi:hypothetical protein
VPLATRIAGYFPGKRLRKVGDLQFEQSLWPLVPQWLR